MNTRAVSNLVFLFLVLPASLCQAQTAFLKSSEIVEGDIAVLIIEYRNRIPSLFPLDTAPLQADFEVLRVKPSLHRNQTDNDVINIMRWEVELFPDRAGLIKIPPLNINGELTPPLMLEVKQANALYDDAAKIYIETTATQKTAYLGQQVLVTVKLFHNQPLRRGILYDLKLAEADIYSLGADRRYSQIIDGESYTVMERKLALFANRTGVLTLPAVEFRGELEGIAERRIKRLGPRLEIAIIRPESEYKGEDWLPANQLDISQQWFQTDKTLTSGDSISRQIILRAKGLPASALPEGLFQFDNPAFEVYADQAQRADQFSESGISGELDQTHAIVFTGVGEIMIPEIQIRWWDVDADVEKIVLLPGKKLQVMPIPVEAPQSMPNRPDYLTKMLWFIAAIIMLLITVILVRRSRQSSTSPELFSRRKLKQACHSGNAQSARNLLIAWAKSQWPQQPITGLYDIIDATESALLKQQLKTLDAVLYEQNQLPWQGQKLWLRFVECNKPTTNLVGSNSRGLPDLYQV